MAVRFGIHLQANRPARDYERLARLVEQYDFARLTIQDNILQKGTWPILTVVALSSERMEIGPSVSHPYVVHPLVIASQIAALDEISGGRAVLGLGRGSFYEVLNFEPRRPVTTVREAILVIRHFLSGSREAYQGEVFSIRAEAAFRFKPLRPEVPIFLGTFGPAMCRVAGELADAVVAAGLWDPAYIPIIQQAIAEGASRVGRPPEEVVIGASPWTAIDRDRDYAWGLARTNMGVYLPHIKALTDFARIPQEEIDAVHQAQREGDFAEAATKVRDESIPPFMAVGTPADIVQQAERMIAAGVNFIVFSNPVGRDPDDVIRMIGEEVLPPLQARYGR